MQSSSDSSSRPSDPPTLRARGDYYDGAFHLPEAPQGVIRDQNPGDPSDLIGEFPWQAEAVDAAVNSARRAFPSWSRRAPEERANFLKAYARALETRQEELAQLISREVGKVLWSARLEAKAMVAKVGITLKEGMRFVQDYRPEGVQGRAWHRPRGVLAVIGPFNFPGHLPNGHIVPALATGNTVVFKASSYNPGVAQLMAECADAAKIPPGVFNLVQVPGREADRLVAHPEVDGVLFTGSTFVGDRIAALVAATPGKMCALEMGGKNAAIVLDDADLDLAVYELLQGAFGNAGQQCTSSSRILVQKGIAEAFRERFVAATQAMKVGHAADPEVYFGPLVARAAAEDFDTWQGVAEAEGALSLVKGGLDLAPPIAGGAYVRPSVHWVEQADPASRYQHEELFAPDTCLYPVEDLDEAIAIANDTEYGLACAILSRSEEAYHEVLRRVRVGILNWNQSTVGASSMLPFGGMKRSGNGHPAAAFSTLYCTYPVASLENAKVFDKSALSPGLVYLP